VLSCPAHARHFGDFENPDSAVSKLVAERSGFGMMPELGYNPVNRYLPPRKPAPVAVDYGNASGGSLMDLAKSVANRIIKR